TSNLGSADVYFQGNVLKWRRFANSLALRYYMRLAEKLPSVAKAGIEKIVSNPTQYPIITAVADDVTMPFPGNSNANSWPSNTTYDTDSTIYRHIKLCDAYVREILERDDPRLRVCANSLQIFHQVNTAFSLGTNRTEDTVVNVPIRKVLNFTPHKI